MKLKGTPKPLEKPIGLKHVEEWMDLPYKELLTKYMRLVLEAESVTYVDDANSTWFPDVPKFTDEEIATLEAIEKEVLKDY